MVIYTLMYFNKVNFFNKLKNFFKRNRESFIISVLASIIATCITAWVLVTIFRTPDFGLSLQYIQADENYESSVLTIKIINKKRWVGFSEDSIYFHLLLPSEIVKNKDFYSLSSSGGDIKWSTDSRLLDKITRDGEEYSYYIDIIHLPVHPDSVTCFLRIKGDFNKFKNKEIYYSFDTPYGFFPRRLKNYESRTDIKPDEINEYMGKLPYIECSLDETIECK